MADNFLCNPQQIRLAEKLRTHREITLDQVDVPLLESCYHCPVLERLEINTGANQSNLPGELQTPMDADTVLHYMEQPNLKVLVLQNLLVTCKKEAKSHYPSIENLNLLGHISALELRQTNIEGPALTKLLRNCHDVRALTLTRPMGNGGGILLDRLGAALCIVAHSLATLTLGYHSVHRQTETTLLEPLLHLDRLQSLHIDPTMYVGRQLCSYWPNQPPTLARHPIVNTRPISEFADVLPDNLESLTLEMNLEQVLRLGTSYQQDLVHSIIAGKSRLRNLKEVTFFEDEDAWANVSYCTCGRCYRATTKPQNGNTRDHEVEQWRSLARQLRKVGVTLFRDVGGVNGRCECAIRATD